MELRVANFKRGPFGPVLGFFDIVIDETFIIRGNAFKQSAKDGKYYYTPKGLPRVDKKTGEAVKNDAGFAVYDNIFDLYTAETPDGFRPTESAWQARAEIIEQATAAYGGAATEQKGRGSKSTTAKAGAGKVKGNKAGTAELLEGAEEGEDDGLPF